MKKLLYILLLSLPLLSFAQAPYSGTIFIEPGIITPSDPSAIESTTYKGQGMVTMYDRRTSDWETVNAFLFDVVWDDGLTCVAQVNPEFLTMEAAKVEAEKYAFLVGQLPNCLRIDVDELWIHKGTKAYGGGNRLILIHTGKTIEYDNNGITEEALIHEAAHTSLDVSHATATDWVEAQNLDGAFCKLNVFNRI
jgi:hypothetical protein